MLNLFIAFYALFLALPAYTQNDPGVLEAEKDLVYYSADIINADLLTETAKLTGNVKILFDEYELNASNAYISKKDNSLTAWGNVKIEGNNSYIEAEKVSLNYKTQEGELEDVRLTSGQLLLEAKKIKKISNEIYEAKKAKFTTCMTCPPSWRIKGKTITTNINKYVDIKGGRFQLLNQTIIPLPHIVFPLNTRRKTGLLQPSLESAPGNSGLAFSQPFFWAIDPHRDLTLSPKFYFNEKKFNSTGGKLLAEYNQWLGRKSRLFLKTAWMYDGAFLDTNESPNPTSRWFLHYNNRFVLPRNVIQKSQLTLLKERTYLNDFTYEVSGRGEAALKNTFSLSKAEGNRFLSAEAVYYINLLVEDPATTDNFSIHKLPSLNYTVTETPFFKNKLMFNSDVTYTNFHRNSRSFDEVNSGPNRDNLRDVETTNATGQFDTTKDLIRTGQRLRLNAEVSAPFKVGDFLDVRPAVSYRDSYYHFNVSEDSAINNDASNPYSQFAFSRYLEFSNSIRTEFSKVYHNQIKHKIVPEIIFRNGSPINQSENIFFRSGDGDGNLPFHRQYQPITDEDFNAFSHGVQFDYWDRFFRANVIEFSLTNIFIKKHRQGLVTYYDQPFFFNLKQSYDFRNQEQSDDPDPFSNLEGTLKFKSKHFTNYTEVSYFYKASKAKVTTSNKFIYKPGRYIQVDYSDLLTADQNGDLTNNRTKTVRLGLGWEFPVLKISGWTAYSLLEKDNQGWGANLSYDPLGNCWGIGARLLKLDDTDKVGVHFSFKLNFGPDARTRKSLFSI